MFQSIKVKGLIIVFIPMLLSAVVFCGLKMLLDNAKEQAAAENHSREIISSANRMSSCAFKGVTAYHMFHTTGNQDYSRDGDQYATRVKQEISQLGKLTKKDHEQHDRVVAINKLADQAIDLLQNSSNVMDADFMMSVVPAMQKKLWILLAKTSKIVGEVSDVETSRTDKSTTEAKSFREKMDRGLFLSMFANVILALALAVFFGRNITNRLSVLRDNTTRFAQGKPLSPPINGGDEIAQLDKAFRAMAQELEHARAREREMERMKQSFIALVSHELRSPLTAITFYLKSLRAGTYGHLTESGSQSAADAITSGERLILLVNEILDAEKAESGQLSVSVELDDLVPTIDAAVRGVKPLAAEKNISFVVDSDEMLELPFDAERIQQVLVNLLSNAIKFSPIDSEIKIRAYVENFKSESGINSAASTNIRVEVHDRGPGISKAEQDQLFQRFYRVESHQTENPHGFGLGLSISKSIILAHGGSMGVESEQGKGSCFWFQLPLK